VNLFVGGSIPLGHQTTRLNRMAVECVFKLGRGLRLVRSMSKGLDRWLLLYLIDQRWC
jgi:hypothetical protein